MKSLCKDEDLETKDRRDAKESAELPCQILAGEIPGPQCIVGPELYRDSELKILVVEP